ncbi:MAG: bacteriohemerythrin [Rhodospirillaceae bacterium]
MTDATASAAPPDDSFVVWSDAMSVGRDSLDDRHKMILDCLNRLHPLLGLPDRDAEIHAVIETLEDFVLVHFSEEEQLLREVGYPDWRAHKDMHDAMYELVFKMKADLEHGRTPDAQILFAILNDWLVGHILGEDRKYMPFLDHPAPSPAPLWHRSNGRPF